MVQSILTSFIATRKLHYNNKNPTSPKETDDGNTMPCISKSKRVIQILQLPYCHVFKSAHLCTMQGGYFSLSFKSERM